jgi:endonuclease/exonuclease/phosphatase family metal-dependent hydrolase
MRKPLLTLLLATTLTACSSKPKTPPPPSPNPQSALRNPQSPTLSLATYNIEHFDAHFAGFHLEKRAATRPADPEMKDLIDDIKRWNNENQWEIAQVFLDPAFSPDIVTIQEGCEQSDLEFFNKRWLNSAYATVIVFPSNTTRGQTVGMMLKPGFEILDRRDQYYKEPDTGGSNTRGDRLFARGPAFVLVKAPTGYTFWVGVTHQKSKSGNNLEVTQWRNRESKRTHEIMKDLHATTGHPVILLGDINDALGQDQFEKDPTSGGDAVELLAGPDDDDFSLATRPLADKNENSFHGYYNTRYRELIDHAVVSADLAKRVQHVEVFKSNPFTQVASDHYPVLVKIDASPAK